MPTNMMSGGGLGLAGPDLGLLPGNMDFSGLETEEEKKRRLAGLTPAAKTSPAVQSLFGLTGVAGGYGR